MQRGWTSAWRQRPKSDHPGKGPPSKTFLSTSGLSRPYKSEPGKVWFSVHDDKSGEGEKLSFHEGGPEWATSEERGDQGTSGQDWDVKRRRRRIVHDSGGSPLVEKMGKLGSMLALILEGQLERQAKWVKTSERSHIPEERDAKATRHRLNVCLHSTGPSRMEEKYRVSTWHK